MAPYVHFLSGCSSNSGAKKVSDGLGEKKRGMNKLDHLFFTVPLMDCTEGPFLSIA
jgi:hypothetical protein